ncbi:hypothetical protein D6D24_06889 [Aureobasidium pullulans]|uniref:Uncharacterized protein n=1 Tax=Aureobasidium pullulans TaxID=5580 RepID=A0A4S9JAT5_AURPU|nr:hypothetical protein D6D26_07481 [Aureobasidium pullulans]THW11960.1 hypothetical protein D6D24_06889 [Aureobasidium pullulans]THX98038.1 hypothetical protein D6D03_08062 [Aureobasidium pullulans]
MTPRVLGICTLFQRPDFCLAFFHFSPEQHSRSRYQQQPMANNSTAQQHQAVAAPGPQPILQQEWDSLIRITQTPSHPKAKWALKKLNKHDKAGQIHEVSGVQASIACTSCANSPRGPQICFVPADTSTRCRCAPCGWGNKPPCGGDCSDAQRAPAGVTPVVGVPPAAANPIVAAGPAIPSGSNQPTAAPVFNQQVSAPVANLPGSAPALTQPGTVSTFTTHSVLAAFSQSANPPIVNQTAVAPVIQQALTSLIPTATTPIIHPIVAAPNSHAQRPASVASQPLSSVPPAPSILNSIPSTWILVSNWAYVIPQPRGGTLTIPAPLRVQTSQQVHHAQAQ